MPPKKMLDRLLRVRTLQLELAAADEARARAKLASETQLSDRIAGLVAAVAPAPSTESALSVMASAHFRERLHQSAHAAAQRLKLAEQGADRMAEATRDARRGRSAIEKLIDRAHAEETAREMRALEAMPHERRVRHDPC